MALDSTNADEPTQSTLATITSLLGAHAFDTAQDRAAWLAWVLSIWLLDRLDGPIPAFVFRGLKGAGKSRLVRWSAATCIGDGVLGTQTWTEDEQEQRATVTAVLTRGIPVAVFDNLGIKRELKGPILDQWLTASVWEDRALGTDELMSLPAKAVLAFAGAGLTVARDLQRRVVVCNVKRVALPRESEPAAAVILRTTLRDLVAAWEKGGSPHHFGRPMAGFEQWDALVGSIVTWALRVDPVTGATLTLAE